MSNAGRRSSPHNPKEMKGSCLPQREQGWVVFGCIDSNRSCKSPFTNPFLYKQRIGCIGVWVFPLMFAGFGFFLQNFQLRIATYYYVHKMVQVDLMMKPKHTPYFKHVDNLNMTFGATPQNVSFGSLEDPVVGLLPPYEPVSITWLDALAALFPLCFAILSVGMDRSTTWTRIMICMGLLSFTKGLFGWITVYPDSNGWQVCRERLAAGSHTLSGKVADVHWYAQEHTLLEILKMNPTSRMCADMMYSGHTYFVTIFALGLHECVRCAMRAHPARYRILAESAVAIAAIIQQSVEIYFVLRSRFHYTSDVVMAVLVTYLLYTNITVAYLTNWWNTTHTKHQNPELPMAIQSEWWDNGLTGSGFVSLGCCCCSSSQLWLHNREQMLNIMDDLEEATKGLPEKNLYKVTPESSMIYRARMTMVEDGSVGDWPCCAGGETYSRVLVAEAGLESAT